jgi:hypothetical protein
MYLIYSSYCLVDATLPPNLLKFVQLLCSVEAIPLLGITGLTFLAKEALGYPVLMLAVDKAAPELQFGGLHALVTEIWSRADTAPATIQKRTSAEEKSGPAACPAQVTAESRPSVAADVSSWHLARRPDGEPAFVVPVH